MDQNLDINESNHILTDSHALLHDDDHQQQECQDQQSKVADADDNHESLLNQTPQLENNQAVHDVNNQQVVQQQAIMYNNVSSLQYQQVLSSIIAQQPSVQQQLVQQQSIQSRLVQQPIEQYKQSQQKQQQQPQFQQYQQIRTIQQQQTQPQQQQQQQYYQQPQQQMKYDQTTQSGNKLVTFRKPRKLIDVKIYASNIPKAWGEHELLDYFNEYDQIYDTQILKDKEQKSRGIGFLKFQSISQADDCIAKYNKRKHKGQNYPMQLKYADGEKERLGIAGLDDQQATKLFVGNVPEDCSQEELNKLFSEYGPLEYVNIALDNKGKSKYFAFVKFHKKEGALLSIKELNEQAYIKSSSKPLEVRFADLSKITNPQQQQIGQIFQHQNYQNQGQNNYRNQYNNYIQRPNMNRNMGKQGQMNNNHFNLFIFHIPPEYREQDLVQLFSPFGQIQNMRLVMDSNDKMKNKGYGFLSYDNLNSAMNAIQRMNGFQINNKRLKVELKKMKINYNLPNEQLNSPQKQYMAAPFEQMNKQQQQQYPSGNNLKNMLLGNLGRQTQNSFAPLSNIPMVQNLSNTGYNRFQNQTHPNAFPNSIQFKNQYQPF